MWLMTRRDEIEGVWVWREKDHVNQEPGKSSSCCWSQYHGDEVMSGLSDCFCRWIKQNQWFRRVDFDGWQGWTSGSKLLRVQELVGDPMSESWWTPLLHISVMFQSMWNFPTKCLWADLSHLGSTLGAVISECMFRSVIGAYGSNSTSFVFRVFKNQFFGIYFLMEDSSSTILY